MILQTIISENASPLKEQEKNFYSSLALIDPLHLYQVQPDYNPRLFQDPSLLRPEIMELFGNMEQILGLFHNSSRLHEIGGNDQVVVVGSLEQALKETPKTPISLDVFSPVKSESTGPLMSFRLEGASSVLPFLKINLEFYGNPEWSPSGDDLILRDSRIAERTKPIFYQLPGLSGVGRMDGAWRTGPSPLFGLLKVVPTEEFRISPEAVHVIDEYCNEAVKDTLTLGS